MLVWNGVATTLNIAYIYQQVASADDKVQIQQAIRYATYVYETLTRLFLTEYTQDFLFFLVKSTKFMLDLWK